RARMPERIECFTEYHATEIRRRDSFHKLSRAAHGREHSILRLRNLQPSKLHSGGSIRVYSRPFVVAMRMFSGGISSQFTPEPELGEVPIPQNRLLRNAQNLSDFIRVQSAEKL